MSITGKSQGFKGKDPCSGLREGKRYWFVWEKLILVLRGVLHIGLRKKITVIPHHITGEKEDFLQKVFCSSFERRYFFLLIMNKREHEVVTVNRLQSQPPPYLDWFKVLLKISAKKEATLQYFNLEEQQQSQIKLKFLLKYACSQKSKNIFPQSISKLSNIPSLFYKTQRKASFYCTVHKS